MKLSTTKTAEAIRLFVPRWSPLESAAARDDVRSGTKVLLTVQLALWRRDRQSSHGDLLLRYGFVQSSRTHEPLVFNSDRLDILVGLRTIEARDSHGVITLGEEADAVYVPRNGDDGTTRHAWELLSLVCAWIGAYEQWVIDTYPTERTEIVRDLPKRWWSLASRAREVVAHAVPETTATKTFSRFPSDLVRLPDSLPK